jgi:glycosyltransferase involved in cell wall biosynthesis
MISIVIPALNEQDNIPGLIHYLIENGGESIKEIIVVDGGSEDRTVEFGG